MLQQLKIPKNLRPSQIKLRPLFLLLKPGPLPFPLGSWVYFKRTIVSEAISQHCLKFFVVRQIFHNFLQCFSIEFEKFQTNVKKFRLA